MTTLSELLDSVQFVVDSAGEQKAVQIDLPVWQKIVAVLQEVDADEADEQRWTALFDKSPDVLARLAAEARAERQAGRVTELDPDLL